MFNRPNSVVGRPTLSGTGPPVIKGRKMFVEEKLRALKGSLCWRVEDDRWTNLWLDFGTPTLEIVHEPKPVGTGRARDEWEKLRYFR